MDSNLDLTALYKQHYYTYSAITLPSVNIPSELYSQILDLMFSIGYQTRYHSYIEIFFDSLEKIDYQNISFILAVLYHFATTNCLTDPRSDTTILLPQISKSPSILKRREINAIFTHKLSWKDSVPSDCKTFAQNL
jgi:hypothetical protein